MGTFPLPCSLALCLLLSTPQGRDSLPLGPANSLTPYSLIHSLIFFPKFAVYIRLFARLILVGYFSF